MAYVKVYKSDISGQMIPEGEEVICRFTYQNKRYKVDLTADEATAFEDMLKPYMILDEEPPKSKITSTTTTPARSSGSKRQTIYDKMGLDSEEKNNLLSSLRDQGKITKKQRRVKVDMLEGALKELYPDEYAKWEAAGKPQ